MSIDVTPIWEQRLAIFRDMAALWKLKVDANLLRAKPGAYDEMETVWAGKVGWVSGTDGTYQIEHPLNLIVRPQDVFVLISEGRRFIVVSASPDAHWKAIGRVTVTESLEPPTQGGGIA